MFRKLKINKKVSDQDIKNLSHDQLIFKSFLAS